MPLSGPLGYAWRKSTRSNPNGACLLVRRGNFGTVLIRNDVDKRGPMVACTEEDWRAFIAGVKAGEFDLPDEGVS